MEKASIKHLDFQLQREKARTKDLEVECKALHAQIAQLEQDKAGLRREKLVLGEEAKKISKLDDRIHLLQKDLENRDAIIASERAAAEQARAETEEIRNNANTSIAQWIDAEKQWTAEQAALNDAALQFRSRIEELEAALRTLQLEHTETSRLLEAERDRAKKIAESRDTLEAEVRNFHAQSEKLQNKICDLEQTIYKLDLAGDKQRETIDLKDTEIRTLETALENERRTVERMEQTITSLNDRVNAVKMVSLGEKGENEKLQCDISDAKKELARLNLYVESLKRDASFSAQSQASLQKALDEMREKCRQQQDDIKEKSVEIRRHELTISQLNVELKRSENQGGEWSFRNSSLEAELQRVKDALKATTNASEALLAEKDELIIKMRDLQNTIEAKDEEMVLLQNQCDEKMDILAQDVRNLEKEVAARQSVIKDLTEQLNSTSEKNAVYHTEILAASEVSEKVRQEVAQMLSDIHAKEQELFLRNCVAEKIDLYTIWLGEWSQMPLQQVSEWFAFWQASQKAVAEAEQRAQALTQNADEAAQTILMQNQAALETERCLAEMQKQIENQNADIANSRTESERLRLQVDELHSHLAAATQQILTFTKDAELLHEQIILKDAALDEKDALHAASQARMQSDLSATCTWHAKALTYCEEQAEDLQALWLRRVDLLHAFASNALAVAKDEKAELIFAKEEAEAACRELTAFAKEAKAAMSKGDRAVAEKQESLLSRIALLEGQTALLRREKEQATTQLSVLLRRFEDEQRAHETYRRETQDALEGERVKCTTAEHDAAKLRTALNYEVSRKCEYKAALESAKKLLSESERVRAAESARALEAIKKANGESSYWVLCFDRLKGMLEQSRKNGKRLPSIDADTLHRLEDAKSNISPIQAQDVNTSAVGAPKLKRLREDTTGAAR